jgi:hypothetical protein
MIIIGIDPGISGALSLIPLYAFSSATAYATRHHTPADFRSILQECAERGQVEAFVESPSLNPFAAKGKFRNSQSFTKLARSLGQWEGLLTGLCIPYNLVSPMKWQNYLSCRTGGDKRVTRSLAIKVFPKISTLKLKDGERRTKVTHDTADSLLIALYGYLQYAPRNRLPLSVRENILLKEQTFLQKDLRTS